jgi:hypothetical protein
MVKKTTMKNNRVWVFSFTYNEAHFVRNFLSAYRQAEKIVIYDNQSTDDTVRLLKKDKRVEIRVNDSGNQIRDDIYIQIKDNCWKEARGQADWVIIVDFDEIFCKATYNNGRAKFSLDFTKPYNEGYTIIKPYGYNMVAINGPLAKEGHPFRYVKKGVYHELCEKPCCFRPEKIQEINFYPGCHGIDPKGEIKIFSDPDYKLLHFKLWNYSLYLIKAMAYKERLSAENIKYGYGFHYTWSAEKHAQIFMDSYNSSKWLFDITPTHKMHMI